MTAPEQLVARLRAAGSVFAEEEAEVLLSSSGSADELERMLARRVSGEPLEHVVGWVRFDGLRLLVDPGVFVPRRRTEALARAAAARARAGSLVVDLCCGCGAIGAAVLARVPGVEVLAADVDPAAVACARRNLGDRVRRGDLFAALPTSTRGRIDVIAANAPYVPTDAVRLMPREARLFEPRLALDGGADGVALHRRIAAEATEWLAPGGAVLIESSEEQAELTEGALRAAGFAVQVEHDDEVDGTVVIGTLPVP